MTNIFENTSIFCFWDCISSYISFRHTFRERYDTFLFVLEHFEEIWQRSTYDESDCTLNEWSDKFNGIHFSLFDLKVCTRVTQDEITIAFKLKYNDNIIVVVIVVQCYAACC